MIGIGEFFGDALQAAILCLTTWLKLNLKFWENDDCPYDEVVTTLAISTLLVNLISNDIFS